MHTGWFERIESSYYRSLGRFLKSSGTVDCTQYSSRRAKQLIAAKADRGLKTGRRKKLPRVTKVREGSPGSVVIRPPVGL